MGTRSSAFSFLQQGIKRLKPYLRWVILGATFFFVAQTLRQHWAEVVAIRLREGGVKLLAIALAVTLIAHIWSGWVWGSILRELNQPAKGGWSILVYLRTNIAKYLPGNVWHFYGRVLAAKEAGFPMSAAALSVVMEPLLMAAAALILALITAQRANTLLQVVILLATLAAVHPRLLNPLLEKASRAKQSALQTVNLQSDTLSLTPEPEPSRNSPSVATVRVRRYPLLPLLGELGFVLLRGCGFLFTVLAIQPLAASDVPTWFNGFSIAWLLGLVVPGAPGGIGVFESTAIALLGSSFTPAVVLSVVALYRLISTLAECIGAGLSWLGHSWEQSYLNR